MEEHRPEQFEEMGDGAAGYSELGQEAEPTGESAKEFLAGLAVDAENAGQIELKESILRRTARTGDKLIPHESPDVRSGFGGKAGEAEARAMIADAIKDALQFLADPNKYGQSEKDGGRGSRTLADLNLGNEFDARVGAELMEIFGAVGQREGDPVLEQNGRFARTTYNTVIPGVQLKRWRHHPSGSKTDTPADFEKFYLHLLD